MENKSNLPQFIYRALAGDEYDREGSNLSISDVINPVQIRILKKLHGQEIEANKDVLQKVAAFIGTAVHEKIERAYHMEIKKSGSVPEVQEVRYKTVMEGLVISGKPDCHLPPAKHLFDVKVTKTSKILWGEYDEWTKQINCYIYLLSLHGFPTEKCTIIAFLKDWDEKNQALNGKYPEFEIAQVPLKIAPLADIKEYLTKRVLLHKTADETGIIPECSDKSRWKGNLRCKKYCDVAPWCQQWNKLREKKNG